MTSVAVVTPVHGRHEHLRAQQRSLLHGSQRPLHVLVSMDDEVVGEWPDVDGLSTSRVSMGATGGQLPLAEARNLGAAHAIARGADVVVFLDVDCLAGPDLVASYVDAATRDRSSVWSGPVTYLPETTAGLRIDDLRAHDDPHPARPAPAPGVLVDGADPDLFWSLSFALHADSWERSGGFCVDFVGYGGEDTDFALSVLARGLRLAWTGSARAYHQWHPVSDPPVEHLDDILRNGALFASRWGRWPMTGWFERFERLGLVRRTEDGWEAVPED